MTILWYWKDMRTTSASSCRSILKCYFHLKAIITINQGTKLNLAFLKTWMEGGSGTARGRSVDGFKPIFLFFFFFYFSPPPPPPLFFFFFPISWFTLKDVIARPTAPGYRAVREAIKWLELYPVYAYMPTFSVREDLSFKWSSSPTNFPVPLAKPLPPLAAQVPACMKGEYEVEW